MSGERRNADGTISGLWQNLESASEELLKETTELTTNLPSEEAQEKYIVAINRFIGMIEKDEAQIRAEADPEVRSVLNILKAIRGALKEPEHLEVTVLHTFEGSNESTTPEQVAQEVSKGIDQVIAGDCDVIYFREKLTQALSPKEKVHHVKSYEEFVSIYGHPSESHLNGTDCMFANAPPLYVRVEEPISAGNLPQELRLEHTIPCPLQSEISSSKESIASEKTPSSKVSYKDLVISNPFTSKNLDFSTTISVGRVSTSEDQTIV